MDKIVIDKLKDFVEKIKSKDWEIDKRANQIILEDGKAVLAVWLAKMMSEFELAEEPKPIDSDIAELLDGSDWRSKRMVRNSHYERIVKEFNEMVNQATIHDVIIDNKLKKELKESQEKCSELEKKLEKSKSMNTELEEDKITLQKRIDRIYQKYPAIKENIENPDESELTDG